MTSLADIYAWSRTTRSIVVDGELLDLCKRCNERKDD